MADKGGLTTEEAAATLRPFVLDFGLHAVGADTVTVHVELSNTGRLPVEWEMLSYDDPQLEMENWVEPGAVPIYCIQSYRSVSGHSCYYAPCYALCTCYRCCHLARESKMNGFFKQRTRKPFVVVLSYPLTERKTRALVGPPSETMHEGRVRGGC
jgi:hypothetical protein